MTSPKAPSNPLNLGAHRLNNKAINKSHNSNIYDIISNRLAAAHGNNTLNKGKFLGYCLHSRPLMETNFKSLYDSNDPFKEFIKTSNSSPNGHYVEAYVHIPEISALLPWPNLGHILEYYATLAATPQAPLSKSIIENATKAFEIVSMYPRFYEYTTQNQTYTLGQVLEVEPAPSQYPTKGAGKIIKLTSKDSLSLQQYKTQTQPASSP